MADEDEQDFIKKSIESIINQTTKPQKVIYVNDSSTDKSRGIIEEFSEKYKWIDLVDHESKQHHLPGSKDVDAINFGLKMFDLCAKTALNELPEYSKSLFEDFTLNPIEET